MERGRSAGPPVLLGQSRRLVTERQVERHPGNLQQLTGGLVGNKEI